MTHVMRHTRARTIYFVCVTVYTGSDVILYKNPTCCLGKRIVGLGFAVCADAALGVEEPSHIGNILHPLNLGTR